jgi:hypothetical protein
MGILLAAGLGLALFPELARPAVVVVVGAPGTPEYESIFRRSADQWRAAAEQGGAAVAVVGGGSEGPESDRDRLQTYLARQQRSGPAPLWVVLLGHGTDDGRDARFNLRGPDLTAIDLAEWLTPVKRPVAVVNCASSSATFLNLLSGPGRVVVTATRAGSESNYARFGEYLSRAIADPAADLDRDGQVSLLEAFLSAADRVSGFYKDEGRLATEHPLIDDNGDKLGSPADWFEGVRAVRRAKDGALADGPRAHQWHLVPSARERALPAAARLQRDELEQALAALRDQKAKLGEEAYYAKAEMILVELARLYRDAGVVAEVK